MQPWGSGEVTNEPTSLVNPADAGEPGPEYYSGELAFDWSEDKAFILDNLDGYLSSYCDWHRIRYHVCDHDATEPDSCNWDEVRESGTIPSDVPMFE